jgi:hypothetical protein
VIFLLVSPALPAVTGSARRLLQSSVVIKTSISADAPADVKAKFEKVVADGSLGAALASLGIKIVPSTLKLTTVGETAPVATPVATPVPETTVPAAQVPQATEEKSSSSNMIIIIGAAVGGVVLLVAVISIVAVKAKKKKNKVQLAGVNAYITTGSMRKGELPM